MLLACDQGFEMALMATCWVWCCDPRNRTCCMLVMHFKIYFGILMFDFNNVDFNGLLYEVGLLWAFSSTLWHIFLALNLYAWSLYAN